MMVGLLAACAALSLVGVAPTDWKRLPDLPDKEGLAGGFAGVSHGWLVFAGGANFPNKRPWEGGAKVWYGSVFAFKPGATEWKAIGSLPRPLAYGVSATLGNEVILAGGSGPQNHYSDVYRLSWDGRAMRLEGLPNLPVPVANGCGTIVKNTLFVACGQERPDSLASNRLFALDLSKPKAGWQELESLPGPGRILPTASRAGGRFWVIGGAKLVAGTDGTTRREYLRDAYCYTIGKGWRRVPDLPYPVVAAPSPAPHSRDSLFILGGDDGSQVGIDPLTHKGFRRTVLRLHIDAQKWSEEGEMPVGRVTAPVVDFRGRWHVVSGEQRPGIRSPEVWSVKL